MNEVMNARTAPRTDDGFTLVELLIVIVILGVLASVTVYTVSGLSNRGQTVAQTADAQLITRAQEMHYAQEGEYASEQELVDLGFLRRPSTFHDVELAVDRSSYTLAAEGTVTTTTTP